MRTKHIAHAVNYCKNHDFFHATSVFLTKMAPTSDNKLAICVIYMNSKDLEKNVKPTECNYEFIPFSIQDIYSLILKRDYRIVTVFSQAIPLLDKANIASRIYSSVTPIRLSNKLSVNNKTQMELTSKNTNKSFSMLFCGIESHQAFITNTFIPLCSVIKDYLVNYHFKMSWESEYNSSRRSAEITFISDKMIPVNVMNQLQIYLYNNVSELYLGQIVLPYYQQDTLLSGYSESIIEETNDILCTLSEDLLEQFTKDEMDDNKRVTRMIYYYILAAKSFFSSKKDFLITNKIILEKMLNDGISPFTKSILDHQTISNARDKLLHEYAIISDRTKTELWSNYSGLLSDWNTFANGDKVATSLQSIRKTRSIIKEEQGEEKYYYTNFFLEFYKLIIQCWDIPYYYRAYIPFCIKYISSYEI